MTIYPTTRDRGNHLNPIPRVLHVIGALNMGGAENLLLSLYRGVDRSRVQFDFLVYTQESGVLEDELLALGGRVHRLPPPSKRGLVAAVKDIRGLIRENGPYMAVHAHILHASAIAMIAAKREGVAQRITHSHNTSDVSGRTLQVLYHRWARRTIKRYSTDLLACGTAAGEYLFGAADCTILRNGVDLHRFGPQSSDLRSEAREELGVPAETLLVGSVARFEEVKNHGFLIRVAEQLRDHAGREVMMAFVGEGALRSDYERRVLELDLQESVLFLGLRRDIPKLMAGFDVLAMPSHYEGIPVVLMEAQAVGLPALVSDAVSEEVDFQLGLLEFLPIKDPEIWTKALAHRTPRTPVGPEHRELVRNAGGDLAEAVELLERLYGVRGTP